MPRTNERFPGGLTLQRLASRSDQLLFLLCLAGGAFISWRHSTDANWDLQNYHIYGPAALISGRIGRDYLVAGMEGYLNPLSDIPYFVTKFMLFPHHPRIVAALAGLPFGLLVFLTISIARLLTSAGSWEPFAAVLLGLTGATTVSEIGTTQNDVLTAALVLLSVFVLLNPEPIGLKHGACAGLILGFATGLKFTTLIFLPGLALMAVIQAAGLDQRLRICFVLLIASAFGFIAAYGWWGWILWRHFHDPFYPMLTEVFPTPWAVAIPFQGAWFFPSTVLQWIFYPFFWLRGRSFVVSEQSLRDPRFAIAFIAIFVFLVGVLRHGWRAPGRRVSGLWSFVGLGYLCWLIGFSNLRYALALEAIIGIFIWTLLRPVFAGQQIKLILAALLIFSSVVTRPITWGHIPYFRNLIEAPVPRVTPDGIVFIVGMPLGFVVQRLETADNNFIRLDMYTIVPQELAFIKSELAAGKAVQLLTNLPEDASDNQLITTLLSNFGLRYQAANCVALHLSPGITTQAAPRLCTIRP